MSRSPILDLAREKLKTTSNAAKSAEGPLILHEGMWDAWRTQFDAGLNAQLLRVTSSESPDMTPYEFKIWTWHAFAYIGMRVSPYVLERVAKTGSKNAFRFLETLRMLAQPFPFFCKPDPKDKGQLSYDERRCVYDHLQELQPRVVNVIFKRPAIGFCEEMTMRDAKVPPCMPAITQVNRALREETRATAIRKTIFKFTILSGESLVGCLQDFEPYLRRWLQNDIREDDDLLWKIRLCTPEDIEMTFAGNVVTVQSLDQSLWPHGDDMHPFALAQQARDERLQKLQNVARGISARPVQPADWKAQAILAILQADDGRV